MQNPQMRYNCVKVVSVTGGRAPNANERHPLPHPGQTLYAGVLAPAD